VPLVKRTGTSPAEAPAPDLSGLTDGTDDERWSAARDLSGRADAVEALNAALSREHEPRVREAILTSLARVGTPRSAEAMLPMIRSDDASQRTGALDALRLMPAALDAHLAGLLADPDPDVRLLACDLARELPSAAASDMLCALLITEGEANVAAAAVDVLAEVGGPGALPGLEACAARFADVLFLAFAVKVAIERIGGHAPTSHG
jgi:HEAT repeat protein